MTFIKRKRAVSSPSWVWSLWDVRYESEHRLSPVCFTHSLTHRSQSPSVSKSGIHFTRFRLCVDNRVRMNSMIHSLCLFIKGHSMNNTHISNPVIILVVMRKYKNDPVKHRFTQKTQLMHILVAFAKSSTWSHQGYDDISVTGGKMLSQHASAHMWIKWRLQLFVKMHSTH